MKKTLFTFCLILLSLASLTAQWTKISSVSSNDIVALAVDNQNLYAVSDSNIYYKSSDTGSTWVPIVVGSSSVELSSICFFKNRIYVGTYNSGILQSTDGGTSWQNMGLANILIAGFAIKDSSVYAATDNGVAKLNSSLNGWTFMNSDLPSYSMSVNQIIASPDFLLIAAGANGTYYKYDFINAKWLEYFYYGNIAPGLQINNLLYVEDLNTIFAVNRNHIIKSTDEGITWVDDKTGAQNGYSRNIRAGADNYYCITNLLSNGTWIQIRDNSLPTGASWATQNEFLPIGYSYDILEFQNKLFLAKDDGLYTKDIVLDIENPTIDPDNLILFPNPSNGKELTVRANKRVHTYALYDITGAMVQSATINRDEFSIPMNYVTGVYFITCILSDGRQITKRVVQE